MHPLLTINFFSKWFLPLEKRKMSSIMDGLQIAVRIIKAVLVVIIVVEVIML